ncbi:MAG TPA: ABC transporter ATP-binding protein, partial [Pyrinomonadaceae bacterium]|nr:ABC transporter ATP-binding protein [Pyrinomonadaceae bacterium]
MAGNGYRLLTMTTALRVENVSKMYRIYDRPGDRLKEMLTQGLIKRHREFWALRDISFEVEGGTTTGIIGPNGSGKSTLLQIVTGTLEPTHGSIHYEGRVAALLELGAGFNPEFTGIENVYLNASLLGFSKKETKARLPEIERFAEIGQFIHQPVKTYSTGMYVRLAFAIAVCASPQILVVDEALAVGDTIFQHRCIRRIKEMQDGGTTVLFVSHDPTVVRALCSRTILLKNGRILADGKPMDVLNRYQELIMKHERGEQSAGDLTPADNSHTIQMSRLEGAHRHGDGTAEIISAELLNSSGQRVEVVESAAPLTIRFQVLFHKDIDKPVFGFMIRSRHGINDYGTNTEQRSYEVGRVKRDEVIEICFNFKCHLGQEHYFISLAVHSPDGVSYDWIDGVIFFRVFCPVEME